MRRRSPWGQPLPALALAVFTLAVLTACGKKGEPVAPYSKTPQPPSGLQVSQVGPEIEIQVTAPRTTTENRPLPVIELEWLEAPVLGDFRKVARPILREEVAPGELRTKRFPLPTAPSRLSVRAYSGRARSNNAPLASFLPAPVPTPPGNVAATATATGVQLNWTNPPGAEPWPSPTPVPTPTPRPTPTPQPGAAPSPTATPNPAASSRPPPPGGSHPDPKPGGGHQQPPPPEGAVADAGASATPAPVSPSAALEVKPDPQASPRPGGSPLPSPTPVPLALPSGIRIFRTDGAPRLAREPLQAASWLDTTLKPGDKPCYALRYAATLQPLVESAPTEPVCTEFKDLVVPEPPARLLGDIGPTFVELSWLASPSTDVAFYRVYRTMETEARAMVIQTEGLLLRVRDLNMTSGPRTYDVVAVDKGGNESSGSPELKIVIP